MNSKILITILSLLIYRDSNGQDYLEIEKEYNANYKERNFLKAIDLAEKLKEISKKQSGIKSFEFSKACYYLGLSQNLNNEDSKAILNLKQAILFFDTEEKRKCGSYHNLIDKLAYCYFNVHDNVHDIDSALKFSDELINRERVCQSLNDLESKNAYNLYAKIQLRLPNYEKFGISMIEGCLISDIEFINSNSNKPWFNEVKEYYFYQIVDHIEDACMYFLSTFNLGQAIRIIERLNELKIPILDPQLRFRILKIENGIATFFGDYEKVVKLSNDQIDIIKKKKIFSTDSLAYYVNLGDLYQNTYEFENAIVNYENGLNFYEKNKIKQVDFPKQTIYSSLSLCYAKKGDYIKSNLILEMEKSYLISINDFTLFKELSVIFFKTTNYIKDGNYSEAYKLSNSFNKIVKKQGDYRLNERDQEIILSMKNLNSEIYSKLCLWLEWKINIQEELDSSIKDLKEKFAFSSTVEKEIYYNRTSSLLEKLHSNALKATDSKVNCSNISYNFELFSKCILLESNSIFKKHIYETNNQLFIKLYEDLKSLRKYNAKLTSEGSENIELISKLQHQTDSLDQLLSRKMSDYADYKKDYSLTWKDIQSNLNSNEAAIEFERYYNDSDSSYQYMAMLVKPADKYPQLVKLCTENELKQYSPQADLYSLYDLVWKPLLPSLTNVKTIYYSPSGLLNNIPFQALYKKENGQIEYVMDKFTLYQLTSTRYLALDLKKKEQEPIEPSIALFGGINYNDFPNAKVDTINYQSSEAASVFNRELDSTRTGASFLPGTKKEVETISDVLNAKQWQVAIFEGKNATENKIKSLSGKSSKAILHIATHGFAYPDKEEKRKDLAFSMMRGNDKYKASDNPMIRSGLLFGGANMTWQGKGDSLLNTTNEDGVLTAYELSQLDLSKTKLAVLSACETGKGAIQCSEGTFGLKRALKLAGVDNMIVSLWKVPDDATMEMMTLFYTELANTKKPVSSFETAQKAMRIKYPNEPEKWAGFVFVR
jgi:CHAT domain-containing protein